MFVMRAGTIKRTRVFVYGIEKYMGSQPGCYRYRQGQGNSCYQRTYDCNKDKFLTEENKKRNLQERNKHNHR